MGRIALLRRVPAVSVGNIPVGRRIFPAVNAATEGGDGVDRPS